MNDQTALLMFLGRLHPLILHLPIGLWIAIVVMEFGGALVRRAPGRATLAILAWIAALGGAFAAGSGWLLGNEDYSGRTVDLHRWLGVSSAAVGLVAASFAAMQSRGPFRLMLIVEIVLVMAAGHLGSELTRGDQWLFEPFQKKSPVLSSTAPVEHGNGAPLNPIVSADPAADTPVASGPTFATAIAPLLATYCTQCHGDQKQKGELVLNSEAAILLGGENGPVLRSGRPDESPLYTQLLLPADDDLHMPPANKKQPKPEDIAVIGAWIAAGAPFEGAFDPVWTSKPLDAPEVREQETREPVSPPAEVPVEGTRKAEPQKEEAAPTTPSPVPVPSPAPAPAPEDPARGGESAAAPSGSATAPSALAAAPSAPAAEPSPARTAAIAALRARQVHAAEIAEGSTGLWVDFGPIAASTTEDEVRTLLLPVAPFVEDLGLSRVPVSDSLLSLCSSMPRLQRLDLRSTKCTPSMLQPLARATTLRELVLADTRLDDTAVDALLAMPSLCTVYVWNSGLSAAGIARLAERKDLVVDNGDRSTSAAKPDEVPASNDDGAPLRPKNTTCPVSGKPVDLHYVIVHEQRAIGFCCPNCPKSFWTEPAKYPVEDR